MLPDLNIHRTYSLSCTSLSLRCFWIVISEFQIEFSNGKACHKVKNFAASRRIINLALTWTGLNLNPTLHMEFPYISVRFSGRLQKFHIYSEDLYGILGRNPAFSFNFIKEIAILEAWYPKKFACGAFLYVFSLLNVSINEKNRREAAKNFGD